MDFSKWQTEDDVCAYVCRDQFVKPLHTHPDQEFCQRVLPMRFFQGFPLIELPSWTDVFALLVFLLIFYMIYRNYNYFDRKPDVRKKDR